jgi:predicted GNAT family N-acyltransferase
MPHAPLNIEIEIDVWLAQQAAARVIRAEVFIAEQGVPIELEWDEEDARSLHALARDQQGCVLGTGRLLPDGHIGRMAVLKDARGRGIGSAILRALMQRARRRGDRMVALHAQVHAEAFYAGHGFVREGDVFDEAGIAHVLMRHVFFRDALD